MITPTRYLGDYYVSILDVDVSSSEAVYKGLYIVCYLFSILLCVHLMPENERKKFLRH